MDEDSPLLTPEEPKQRDGGRSHREAEEDPLLTPESERVDRGPAGRGENREELPANGKRKLSQSPPDDAGVPQPEMLQRSNSSTFSHTLSGGFGAVPNTPYSGTPRDDKYKKIKKVGSGAYGKVYMAECIESKEIVAMKECGRKDDPIYQGFPLSILREISILRSLKHENIVQLYEIAQDSSGSPVIVMEYCQSSLLELLNSRKHSLSFSEVKYIIRQIIDATRHMHDKGILHRDLATKNVLFNISGEIKVCDFGISRFAFGHDEEFGFLSARNLENPNMIVSLPYRAVELLLGQEHYGPALDVWAAGCIFGEILLCQGGERRTFFGGDPPNKTPQAIVEEIFIMLGRPSEQTWPGLANLPLLRQYESTSPRMDQAQRQKGDNDERLFMRRFFTAGVGKCAQTKYSLTEKCFDLLGELLTLCPTRRQTAAEALKHPFFSEKPLPEWHAWHWSLDKQIARGDDMRTQEKDAYDESKGLIRKLSCQSDDLKIDSKTGAVKSAKEQAKEALLRRAKEKKEEEERKLAAAAAAKKAAEERAARGNAARNGGHGADGDLPPGWTKHWSSSKQRYYYHDSRSGENKWHAPSGAPRR